MDDTLPRLSVLMPIFNAEAYLVEAIESVLAQTMPEFEFLILDDGSTDRSAAIVKRYAALDNRIRFWSCRNRGASIAMNEMATAARAPWLARMDHDDICRSDRFEKQLGFLADHPEIDLLGGHTLYVDAAGYPIFVPQMPLEHADIDATNLAGHASIAHPTVIMRTKLFHSVGGYDSEFDGAEDLELWLRMAEHGRLANMPDVLLEYRISDTSISGSRQVEQQRLAIEICEIARKRRGLPPIQFDLQPWRPTEDAASRLAFFLQWGWQAWKADNRATARRYFIKAIRIAPLSIAAWKALVFGALSLPTAIDRSSSD